MATIPTEQTPQPASQETVEERFRRLEAIWHADVCYSSSSREIRGHPAFQEIIGMGEAVVPLMLRDLEQAPHFWVWALLQITGANPVAASDRGNIVKRSEAWVRWGKENGIRW